MLKRRYIILTFILLVCIYSLYAHNPIINLEHNPFNKFVEVTSPTISCNIDGWTFRKITYYHADGSLDRVVWNNEPKDPVIKLESKGHGLGYAQVQFWGKINGKDVGNEQNLSRPIEIGAHVPGIPFGFYGHDIEIHATEKGTFNKEAGTYPWEGEGIVHYTPYYYKVRAGLPLGVSGTWEDGATATTTGDGDGHWTVKHSSLTYYSSGSPNDQEDEQDSDDGDEEEDSEDSEDTSPSNATVPDSPSNLELSPRRIAILVRWDDPASDGGSPITDYQYSYRRKRTATSWTAWSDWTSAGTGNSTWITGLRSNRRYAVRLRAVNSVGASYSTSQIADTSE